MKAVAVVALLLGFLANSHALSCREAPALRRVSDVDAGLGQVVATDVYSRAYFLSGTSWYRMGTVGISQVSVGAAGTWGTDRRGYLYKYISGNFQRAGSGMRMVNAGGMGAVVGITTSSVASCIPSSTAAAFSGRGNVSPRGLRTSMLDYSCGPYGCWGTDTRQRILYSALSPTTCRAASWSVVSGSLRTVTVGSDGAVFGVNRSGQLYQRLGIYSRRPQGTSWRLLSTCTTIRNVAYDLRTLWLQTTTGFLLQCTV